MNWLLSYVNKKQSHAGDFFLIHISMILLQNTIYNWNVKTRKQKQFSNCHFASQKERWIVKKSHAADSAIVAAPQVTLFLLHIRSVENEINWRFQYQSSTVNQTARFDYCFSSIKVIKVLNCLSCNAINQLPPWPLERFEMYTTRRINKIIPRKIRRSHLTFENSTANFNQICIVLTSALTFV